MSEFSNQEVPPFSTGPKQKPEPGVKHSPKSSQILAIVALAISIMALAISQGSLDRKEQSEQLSSAVSEADLYSPPNDLKKLISTVEESLVAIETRWRQDRDEMEIVRYRYGQPGHRTGQQGG